MHHYCHYCSNLDYAGNAHFWCEHIAIRNRLSTLLRISLLLLAVKFKIGQFIYRRCDNDRTLFGFGHITGTLCADAAHYYTRSVV